MNKCFLCDNDRVESSQATEQGRIHEALDVDCPHCGIYRISGRLLVLKSLDEALKKDYSKFLNERSAEEKQSIYWVTTEGIAKHEK